MGEANQRGTRPQRVAQADARREQDLVDLLNGSDVCIFLSAKEGKLDMKTITAEEKPNNDNVAVLFAAYLNANFSQLAGEAASLAASHAAGLPSSATVVEPGRRSVIGSDGQIARAGEAPAVLGPDGRPIQ